MPGKIDEKLQEQTAATAFQLVWSGIKGAGSLVVDKNAVQRGMMAYARKFLERFGNVKILNMDQPVPLSEIYVAAQVLSPRVAKRYRSVDELHELFLQRGQRYLFLGDHAEERQDCLELANQEKLLNVLGSPGAGKSTFLCRLGLEALRPRRAWSDSILKSLGLKAGLNVGDYSRYNHECLPVLLELRRFRTDEIDVIRLIQNELEICGLPESNKLIKNLLDGGRFLLLLDGVDEVPGDKLDKAIMHMRDFMDRYSGNRFVVSCRTAFYKDYFSRFRDVLLADFDDQQVASFVHNWFRSAQDRQQGIADEFLSILEDPTNASAKELASTPLLLTFLCLTYDDRQRLPPNRSELYRQALEILMERWAASKRVHNEPIYREFHARLEVQMLAEIAASNFRDNRYFFTRRELNKRISDFLRDELHAPKHLDSDQVLNAIEVQQGLIVQRAQDAWSFSHLTLQEYLTAVWYESKQHFDELIAQHLLNVRWREVFILLAGTVDKADILLNRMLVFAEKLLAGFPRAIQLLKWANERVVATKDSEQELARRSIALTLSLDLDRTIYYALAHHPSINDTHISVLERTIRRAHVSAAERSMVRSLDHRHELTRVILSVNSLSFNLAQALGNIINRTFHQERVYSLFEGYARSLSNVLAELEASQCLVGAWHNAAQQVDAVRFGLIQEPLLEENLEGWGQCVSIFSDALCLPLELRDLNEEWRALEAYINACSLIIDCKNAATLISRPAWDSICKRMLKPPEKAASGNEQGKRNRKAQRT
ncbi:hypothetical protein [Archangium sp.]|jgi:predicted NACHT family NTPase|uniref:NACHT domain-containing protein n=1 Tax=Archangium sp. TaxID=1872627 RepID=UPI002ED86A55